MATSTLAQRFFSPGEFRLLLSLLVFVHHVSRFSVGSYAVDLFFVLSGYWIHRMWTNRYSRLRSPYLTYFISRAWRLIPVFVLAGLVSIAIEHALGIDRAAALFFEFPIHFPLSQLFILGYASLLNPPVVPGWSLDIEMQFYLVAPILVIALRAAPVWPLLLAGAILSFAAASLLSVRVLPQFLIFFLIGMAAARLDTLPSRRLAAASAIATVVVLLAILVSPLRGTLLIGSSPGPLAPWNAYVSVLFALLSVPLALHTTRQRADALDACCGDLSYIVYLLHWPAVVWLTAVGGSAAHRLPFAVASAFFVLGAAILLWRFFDRPINRARARWVAGRTHVPAVSVAAEPSGP